MSNLQTHFMSLAAQQGWNEPTMRHLMLDFIENNADYNDFNSYLDIQVAKESQMSNDETLGVEQAIKDIKDNDQLSLYECEIGLSSSEEQGTLFETFMVLVASESAQDASEKARNYCEENIPVVSETWFEATCAANEVDASDYL